MTLLSAALPYVGGGVLGSAVTYGLTWVRERRRSLDAYRAPQRQAIGEIVSATHEFMLRELDSRTVHTELLQRIRTDQMPDANLLGQLTAVTAEFGKATLAAEQVLQVGRLTIVDAPCWEALGASYVAFTRLRCTMAARVDQPPMKTAEEIERYLQGIQVLAGQYHQSVLALVIAAADRISPAETFRNRRLRRSARRRLADRFGSAAEVLQFPDAPSPPTKPDHNN